MKLVYAKRTSVGRIRDISDDLKSILKDLVYDGITNNQKYEKLVHDDKQIFHEIIKACHLEYKTREKLQEPTEHLVAEYNKLRGEIALGNDSKSILKELKALAIDMFENGLISKKAFKEISVL